MASVTAVVHNGRIELARPVDWLDGTQVEVTPLLTQPSEARRSPPTFPLHRSAERGALSVEQIRAAEETAALEEDSLRGRAL